MPSCRVVRSVSSASTRYSRIFILYRGDLMNAVGATNGFRACLAETEKADLAVLHQGGHGAYRLFDRLGWIDAALIVHIAHLDAEALHTGLPPPPPPLLPPLC